MLSENELLVKSVVIEGGDPEHIVTDDSEEGKYKISIPLLYDFQIFPKTSSGKSTPVSSIEVHDTRTIINMAGNTDKLILRMLKRYVDPTGVTTPPDPDESGDRFRGDRFNDCAVKFVNWLENKKGNVDKKTEEFVGVVHNARREIIIQKEETKTG